MLICLYLLCLVLSAQCSLLSAYCLASSGQCSVLINYLCPLSNCPLVHSVN